MPTAERSRFQQVWARVAPAFYFDNKAPMPAADPKNDMWMIALAWAVWQEKERKDA